MHRTAALLAASCLAGIGMAVPAPGESEIGPNKWESTGPWGKLEYFRVVLEPPKTHLWDALYDDRSFWNFGALGQSEAAELLARLGLSEESLALIRDEGRWSSRGSGTELDLSDAIVESLTPENRVKIAEWLRAHNEPFFSTLVINLEGGNLSAFENGNVSAPTLDLVRRLAFARNNVLSLMDGPYIMRQLGGDLSEKENFLRAAFATPSLVVKLVVDETSDTEALARYWSRDGMNSGVESILRGVQSTRGVERLDIVHLLPPIPKKHLNAFTNLREAMPLNSPNCFWISMQFFRSSASPRLLDALLFGHYIEHEFEPVADGIRFGDIVCMFDRSNDLFVHSYVHIADEIVFTKNGASLARPFVLTRKQDMMSVYLDETAYRFEVYRRKLGT
jgi:hypothetical protein